MSVAQRLTLGIGGLAATLALAVPQVASAGLVDDVLGDVNESVGTLLGGGSGPTGGANGAAPAPAAGVPPTYTPPLHGDNPHGQGTVGVVDVSPEASEPLPYDPEGGSEDSVIARSRGEQNDDGTYHGHITLVSTFLTGELVGCDTNEGETCTGPLGALNAQTCDLNGGGTPGTFNLCLLAMNSETDEDGSTNGFAATRVNLGGAGGITAGAAESNGNISDDGECQTAHGDSSVANASVGGALTALVLESSSDSEACNDGTETVEQESRVVDLNENGLPVPEAGCADGTPNSNFDPLLPLLGAVCNADDTNGSQTDAPYGVREALSLFVLDLGGVPLLKTTTAAAESHAVAPGDEGPECPDPNNPDCDPPPACPDPDNPECDDDPRDRLEPKGPDGPGPSGDDPDGQLPFTGADLGILGLIGALVMGAGLVTMAAADRRRRVNRG